MPEKPAWERCINVQAPRVIIAGGGTGGHLFPALAIAEEIRKMRPDAEILFIGTKNKIEAKKVPAEGYHFRPIWISGFRRRFTLDNIVFPVKVIVAMIQSMSILRNFRPAVVVGTGGYVSGPVLYAATLKHIPTLIQEQNSYPGITTRMLGLKVNELHLAFEQSRRYFSRTENVYVSGNPTRSSLDNVSRDDAARYFGFSTEKKKTLLVFGGSLGAHSINKAMIDHLPGLLNEGLRIVWQTGPEDFNAARQRYSGIDPGNLWINPFIDRMDFAYAVSDLVVCRAGATTIAELTRTGKPSILVPYPFAAANHQVENARSMVEAGASVMIEDRDLDGKMFESVVSLFAEDRLHRMSGCSKRLGKPDAAHVIASRVLRLSGAL